MSAENPYLLDDALAEDGLTFDTWHVPRGAKIEAENPALHLVHADCQRDNSWLRTWCDIAVDWAGQNDVGSAGGDREMCRDCIVVVQRDDGCPSCGILPTTLIAEEDS